MNEIKKNKNGLRPCPCCGSTGAKTKLVMLDTYTHKRAFGFIVCCDQCPAETGSYTERRYAERGWNLGSIYENKDHQKMVSRVEAVEENEPREDHPLRPCPCPFCGGEAEVKCEIKSGYAVYCKHCSAQTCAYRWFGDAVRAWNRDRIYEKKYVPGAKTLRQKEEEAAEKEAEKERKKKHPNDGYKVINRTDDDEQK